MAILVSKGETVVAVIGERAVVDIAIERGTVVYLLRYVVFPMAKHAVAGSMLAWINRSL